MNPHSHRCRGLSRRSFLADTGMGFTGLALGAMLFRDGIARAESPGGAWHPPTGWPHFQPRAKSVIWIFLCGGVSHLESFDVKPELDKYAGKSIADTPYAKVLTTEGKDIIGGNPSHGNRKTIMALQAGHRAYGQCGLVVGDWFKHVGECADDLAVVRSLWTIHNDHGAQLTWQTGRHPRELEHPTLGSWVAYGLGSMNENLPEYVVLGTPTGDCCGGTFTYGAAYLGPEHGGVRLNTDPKNPLPFIAPPAGSITTEEQMQNLSLLGKLNHLAGIDYPDDQNLRARIKSYELAFQMQTSVPETLQLEREGESIRKLYGSPRAALLNAACVSYRSSTAVVVAARGTPTPKSNPTTPSSRPRWTCPSLACSRISSSAGCLMTRSLSSARSLAARLAPRAPDATITRRVSALGWLAVA
jgi:hypothetical protein